MIEIATLSAAFVISLGFAAPFIRDLAVSVSDRIKTARYLKEVRRQRR